MTDDTVKRKIAALLKMTRKAGCSEAEALAAAAKAAELMAEHGLTETDIHFAESKAPARTRGGGRRDRLWACVAYCTNSAITYLGDEISFFGQGPAPEIATYLYTVLDRAIDRELAAYKATSNYRRRRTIASRRNAADDFTAAMTLRLREKLYDLFQGTVSGDAIKAAAAARDTRYQGGVPVVGKAANSARNMVAMSAGLGAGCRVNLAHGMRGGAGPKGLLS